MKKKVDDSIKNSLKELGEEIIKDIKNNIHDDTSNLKNSIEYKIEDNKLIISMLEYAIFLDEGTKPHFPPISSIEGWAKRKGINPWALAKKIERYGTKPQNILSNLKDFENNYLKKLEEDVYEKLEKEIYLDIKNKLK